MVNKLGIAFAAIIVVFLISCPAFAAFPSSGNFKPFVASCSQSTSFIARTTDLSSAEKQAYDQLICGMVSDGTFALLDFLYVWATHSQTDAQLNVVQNSFNLTKHGSCTFTQHAGYTGDGSSCYFQTGFNPSLAGHNMVKGSTSIGLCVTNNRTTPQDGNMAMGADDGSNFLYYAMFTAAGFNQLSIPLVGGALNSTAVTSPRGLWFGTLNGAGTGTETQYNSYTVNGTLSNTTNNLPNAELYLAARNDNGTTVNFTNDQLAIIFGGATLTVAQANTLAMRISDYMTAIGASSSCSPPPPVAANAGLNTKVFEDAFCGNLPTVDKNNTQAGPTSGFKWWVSPAWPNASQNTSANTGGGGGWNTFTVTPKSALTALGCGIKISGVGGTSSGGWVNSAFASGSSYKGRVFTGDFDMRSCTALGSGGLVGGGLDPTIWGMSVQFLLGNTNTFPEFDMEEFATNNVHYLHGIHDWLPSPPNALGVSNLNTNSESSGEDTNVHCYDALWQTAANHSGTGTVTWYRDGTLIATVTYTAGGPASPGASPNNPNGTFFDLEGTQFPLFMTSVGNVTTPLPFSIFKIEIWCASSACMTVKN